MASQLKSHNQPGFTLLEVLIAFIIAAIALAVLFQGAAGGLRAVRTASRYEQATARARSHLAVIGHGQPIAAGLQSGDDGSGFTWRTRIAPAATWRHTPREDDPQTEAVTLTLYDITVAIDWTEDGKPRSVTLQTRRIGTVRQPSS